MKSTVLGCDPASRPRQSWVARLANLKRQGVPDDDERVVECGMALAFYRIRKAIDDETTDLTQVGVERLVGALHGTVTP